MTTASISSLSNVRNQVLLALASLAVIILAAVMVHPIAAVGLAGLPLVIWMVIVYPATWIIVFMALSQYRLPEALPFLIPLKLPLIFGMMAVGAMLWHVAIARTVRTRWRPELIAMVVILLLAVVGVSVSLNRPSSIDYLVENFWKIVVVSLAIAWLLRRQVDFKRFVMTTLTCGILVGAVACYNKLYGIDLVEGTRVTIARALRSPLGDPNDLALTLMCPFSLSLALLVYRNTLPIRLFALATFLITLLAVVFTQSRGGLLAVLAGLGVIGFHLVRSRTKITFFVLAVSIPLFIMMGIGARQSGGFQELAESGLDDSSYLRTLAWTAALNMALHRPFTGVGINAFSSAFYFYTPVWVHRNLNPHSSWFGMLGELGIPGLAALLFMIGHAMLSAQHCKNVLERANAPAFMQSIALGIKASLVTFCVAGTFLGHHTGWPLFTIVALSVALRLHVDANYGQGASPKPARSTAVAGSHPAAAGISKPPT